MSGSDRQYPLPLPPLRRLTAEDFMVTDSNRDAANWIARWPEWPDFSLILCGPAGAGKTHLTEVWRAKSTAQNVRIETLVDAREQDAPLIFDDADKVTGHAEAEENLFHLFNRCREKKQSLLLTACAPAVQWGIALPDLRSRLVAAQTVALHEPDDTLVGAMLIKQFQDRQISVEQGVIAYLLPRIERSPAALRALVEALDHASLATSRGVTIALAKKVLNETAEKS